MNPARKGDGTELSFPGYTEVRKGDGTVLWSKGSAIPDTGILHEWPTDAGSGSTVTDAEASADISLSNGATWDDATDSWWTDWAILYDGLEDYGVVDSGRTDPGDSGTLIMTVRWDTVSTDIEYAFAHPDTNDDNRIYIQNNNNEDTKVIIADASEVTINTGQSTGVTQRIGMTWDSGTLEGWLNGSSQGTTSYSGSVSATTQNWYFGSFDGGRFFGNVYIDYPRLSDDVYNSQQMTDDYDAQPWS